MEIPVVNRIIDFETNIDPSLVSQVSAVSRIGKFYQTYNLWKWGALILALIASFTTIINRIKLLITKLQKNPSLSSSQYHLFDDDYDSYTDSFSSDDEDDEEERENDDDENEEEEEESTTTTFSTSQNWRQVDEDFCVRGSGHVFIDDEQWQDRNLGLRRRRRSIGDLFSWSELMNSGKNVVKLWDNLGLGFGLKMKDDSENEFTIYDMNTEREIPKIASIFGRKDKIPAFVSTSSSSSAVIVSAATNDSGRVTLSGWDTRTGFTLPAILAEWRPKLGNIVGMKAGGIEKVFIRDNVSNALTVGDMRKVNTPLYDPTEADVETWWDADAVIVTEE